MSEIDNKALLNAAREVDLIEVKDGADDSGMSIFAGPYFPQQGELLKRTLNAIQDRAGILVAPDATGAVHIFYRKARK